MREENLRAIEERRKKYWREDPADVPAPRIAPAPRPKPSSQATQYVDDLLADTQTAPPEEEKSWLDDDETEELTKNADAARKVADLDAKRRAKREKERKAEDDALLADDLNDFQRENLKKIQAAEEAAEEDD